MKKFGTITVIGLANAGKSTLVNAMVGVKVSIVSPKIHTTRVKTKGIALYQNTQIVILDTPGFFSKNNCYTDRSMEIEALDATYNCDVALCIFDARFKNTPALGYIWDKLNQVTVPKWLVINKIDLVPKADLLLVSSKLNEHSNFDKTFMISAKTNDGVGDLMSALQESLSVGEWRYPEDKVMDIPNGVLAAEITREQIYIQLHREIPYACRVETDVWEELSPDNIKVCQTIYVKKDAHRKIVIGDNASRIKSIGIFSRRELQKIFDCKSHLYLHVKLENEKRN